MRVYYSQYGNADCSKFINVSAPAAYTTTITTDSSIFGGELTVTGSNINPSAIITVGGFVGKIISQTSSQATFRIPALVTPISITSYPKLALI